MIDPSAVEHAARRPTRTTGVLRLDVVLGSRRRVRSCGVPRARPGLRSPVRGGRHRGGPCRTATARSAAGAGAEVHPGTPARPAAPALRQAPHEQHARRRERRRRPPGGCRPTRPSAPASTGSYGRHRDRPRSGRGPAPLRERAPAAMFDVTRRSSTWRPPRRCSASSAAVCTAATPIGAGPASGRSRGLMGGAALEGLGGDPGGRRTLFESGLGREPGAVPPPLCGRADGRGGHPEHVDVRAGGRRDRRHHRLAQRGTGQGAAVRRLRAREGARWLRWMGDVLGLLLQAAVRRFRTPGWPVDVTGIPTQMLQMAMTTANQAEDPDVLRDRPAM